MQIVDYHLGIERPGNIGHTGDGPSSKELANTPVGESQMSPGILHLYVPEQMVWELGSTFDG